jgi:hypothetical protein
MDKNSIVSILEDAGVMPFYFGGAYESYFWRTTSVDGTIYVQRAWCKLGDNQESFRCCSTSDYVSQQNIYDDIVLDFVVFYADAWQSGDGYAEGALVDIAGVDDAGLQNILATFGKTYSTFLNDVMYWYGIAIATKPDDDGKMQIRDISCFDEVARVSKNVITRLSADDPLVIFQGNTTFVWRLVNARGRIWFARYTYRQYDDHVFCTEEYGRIKPSDADAFNALRDAIRSCFMIDGWELLESESNPEDLLCLVDLSLETV